MGTYAGNNVTLGNTQMGAKQGTKVRTPVTNPCTERETKDSWSQKQDASYENGPKDDAILETPQMNMRQGIKMFRVAEVQAVKKEMQQLHDRKVMAVRHPKELTSEQKNKALAYHMLQGGVAATPAGNHSILINDKDPVMLDKKGGTTSCI